MATDVVAQATTRPPAARATYAPSWVDHLNGWFERLPGPTWLGYTAAASLAAALFLVAESSMITDATSILGALYYAALPMATLALIKGLDGVASQALASLRPLLDMDDDEVESTHHRLTVIPARPAAVAGVFALIITPLGYVTDPVGSGIVGLGPVALAARWLWESFVAAIFLALIYHTVRQLRMIGRLNERLASIDLFDQAPLYAMSRLTSRTAVGLVLLLVPSLFLIPAGADISYLAISGAWYAVQLAIAIAAFLLPLRGIHGRLSAEKRRLQAETGVRLTAAIAAIHRAADAGDAAALDARAKTLAALVATRDVVNRTPTWPWSSGALTGFVSAMVLPIALFLIQRYLSQIF